MAPKKISNRLNALDVTRRGPGMHLDGAGLYLQVDEDGGRSWIHRFTSPTKIYDKDSRRAGKPKVRDYGIGSANIFGLAHARGASREAASQVRAGIDPIDAREAAHQAVRLEASKAVTFDTGVENYIEAHKNSWRTKKHEAQLRSMMKNMPTR